jgi:hypothetical protein
MTGVRETGAATGEVLRDRVHSGHALLLKITGDLDDEQLFRSGGRTAPCIGWHLWHIARWADITHSSLALATSALAARLGERPQLWHARDLAAAWGFDPASLGHKEAGSQMEDESTLAMRFPGREALLGYARDAFAAADEAVATLDAATLDEGCEHFYGTQVGSTTVAYCVQFHTIHAYRHLGSVEALRGVLGMVGTATG